MWCAATQIRLCNCFVPKISFRCVCMTTTVDCSTASAHHIKLATRILKLNFTHFEFSVESESLCWTSARFGKISSYLSQFPINLAKQSENDPSINSIRNKSWICRWDCVVQNVLFFLLFRILILCKLHSCQLHFSKLEYKINLFSFFLCFTSQFTSERSQPENTKRHLGLKLSLINRNLSEDLNR